ncbi:hypothetical protein SLA2020_322530 [Shorea laevis]
MILSNNSTCTIEEVASRCNAIWLFQLYVFKRQDISTNLTSTEVSTDSSSNLEAFANAAYDASLSWKDIGWLRSITKLPILIKGVPTREDGKIEQFFFFSQSARCSTIALYVGNF